MLMTWLSPAILTIKSNMQDYFARINRSKFLVSNKNFNEFLCKDGFKPSMKSESRIKSSFLYIHFKWGRGDSKHRRRRWKHIKKNIAFDLEVIGQIKKTYHKNTLPARFHIIDTAEDHL